MNIESRAIAFADLIAALEGLISRRVINDQYIDVIGIRQARRDALNDLGNCGFSLIRNDENQYARLKRHTGVGALILRVDPAEPRFFPTAKSDRAKFILQPDG